MRYLSLLKKIFGTKNKNMFISPMTGKMIELSKVPDPVFSEGTLGTGFAIEISDSKVVAPFNCEIVSCFPTGHAYGLRSDDGTEVLLHIGLDTVELKGKGFTQKVISGQKVKQGDVLLIVDLGIIKEAGKSLISPVIFIDGRKCKILKLEKNVIIGENDIVSLN